MPPAETSHDAGGRSSSTDVPRRLLRTSHIFASAIREVFDRRLLGQVSDHRLSPTQLRLLRLISRNGNYMVGRVATSLGVSAPSASRSIDRLVGMGLLRRERSRKDRRVSLLRITVAGLELVDRYERRTAEELDWALAEFGAEEIDGLSSLLERFSVSLLDAGNVEEGSCLRCAAYLSNECPVGRRIGGCPHVGPPARRRAREPEGPV